MSRNSGIDRELLGSTVLKLHETGHTQSHIASVISTKNKNFSTHQVQRYLSKHGHEPNNILPATAGPTRNHAVDMLVASYLGEPDQRDIQTEGIEYYGRFSVTTTNVFGEYYEIARGGISGQVTRAFINLALKMTNGIRLVTDESKQDSLDELSDFIQFKTLSQDVARSELEMGTVLTLLKDTNGTLTVPQITPMNYITLVTEKEEIGSGDTENLVHGTITNAVHDEGGDNQIIYEIEDTGLFRLWSGSNYFVDILGRNSFGIYGDSMVPEVKTPLKSMMNASYNYDRFIERYGAGRMHRDLKLIGELVKEGLMKEATATEYMKTEAAAQQKIQANEDIISMGQDISMIENKQGFDITKYLEFREKQIDRALLQSDVSAGRVGSQFTSSGAEVSKQELSTIQSLRDTFFDTMLNQVVVHYLSDYGLDIKDVSIIAEPLSIINVNHRDLIEMEGTGNITPGELRQRAGFPEQKPEVKL